MNTHVVGTVPLPPTTAVIHDRCPLGLAGHHCDGRYNPKLNNTAFVHHGYMADSHPYYRGVFGISDTSLDFELAVWLFYEHSCGSNLSGWVIACHEPDAQAQCQPTHVVGDVGCCQAATSRRGNNTKHFHHGRGDEWQLCGSFSLSGARVWTLSDARGEACALSRNHVMEGDPCSGNHTVAPVQKEAIAWSTVTIVGLCAGICVFAGLLCTYGVAFALTGKGRRERERSMEHPHAGHATGTAHHAPAVLAVELTRHDFH